MINVNVGGHKLVLVDLVGAAFTVEVTGEVDPVGGHHRHHYEHGEVGHSSSSCSSDSSSAKDLFP